MSHSLIVLPDDTANAIIDPINAAEHSLNIRMFLFTDPTLLSTVIAAKKRGVNVRVMLNPARRDGQSDNDEARKKLSAAGSAADPDRRGERRWCRSWFHPGRRRPAPAMG